ncbi:MFS transporter [Cryobacterium sp. AP23]
MVAPLRVAPTPTPESDPAAEARHARRVLAVTTLGITFVVINGSSVNVGLPSMSAHFDVAASTADWFLVAFMLANTASILVFGRISDMLGRKRIYLAGLAAFVVLSVLSVFAPNAGVLIALRVLQGIAAATTVTNTAALIADASPPNRLARGLGLNLTAAAVANTIGPTVGGVLITAFGWQSVFLINVPFGIAAIVLGAYVLKDTHRAGAAREKFDYAGAGLSAAGLAALLYGVNRVSFGGIADPGVIVFIGSGVVLLAAFVVVETRVAHPLVDVSLVRDWGRACAYGAAFFNSFSRAGVVVLVVLHEQIVGDRTPAEAGIVVMVMAIAMMVASPIAGRLSDSYAARGLSALGGLALVVGLTGLAVFIRDDSPVVTMVWLAVVGAGIGLFTAPNTTSIMAGVAPNRRATANAVRSMLFNSAQALGTTVSLLVVAASGLSSYAGTVSNPLVEAGFQRGLFVLAGSALLALVLAIIRGGPWLARIPVGRERAGAGS